MKKYVFKIRKFMNTEELIIIAKDKQTAIQIVKGIVAINKK